MRIFLRESEPVESPTGQFMIKLGLQLEISKLILPCLKLYNQRRLSYGKYLPLFRDVLQTLPEMDGFQDKISREKNTA